METIYAYLAGIIDGEGCISIRKCKQGKYIYFKPMIEVSMTHRPTIEFVAKTFGNSVWYEVRAIYRHKKIYKWRATGTNVIPILKNILPYLITKREQAIVALEMANLLSKKGHKWSSPERIRQNATRLPLFDKMFILNHG